MSKTKSVFVPAVAALVAGLLPLGCESKPTARPPSGKEKMEEIGQMLKTLANDRQPPPAKPADLPNVEPFLVESANDLRSGEIVYAWGNGITPGGTAVIAYEKKAANEGGWVLLQDGTVKQMSASEFQAAPKAAKK